MTGFMIDPERLSASGSALQSVASRLSAELASFQSELAGHGAPWGSDDIGSLIGAAHDEVSSWAVECYQDALDEMGSVGAHAVGIRAQDTEGGGGGGHQGAVHGGGRERQPPLSWAAHRAWGLTRGHGDPGRAPVAAWHP